MNTTARAGLRIPTTATIAPDTGTNDAPNAPAKVPAGAVFRRDGLPITTSKRVADLFGKRHDNVIRAIRTLIATDADLALMFEEGMIDVPTGKGGTRKVPAYVINARGAALLVMGFIGPEALHWKQKFLDAFDDMAERERDNHNAFLRSMKKSPGLTFEQAQKRMANKALKARNADMKQLRP